MAEPDWDDPCVVAKELRAAYYRLISGQQETEVTYLANGATRTLRFQQINSKDLIAELRNAEADCAAKEGKAKPRRRYAIQAGSRRW